MSNKKAPRPDKDDSTPDPADSLALSPALTHTDLEALRRRLQLVRTEIDTQAETSRRKYRVLIFVGILVVSSSFLSLFSITRAAAQLDPEALTRIARYEVEKQLPDGRRTIQVYLETEAPRLVSSLIDSLIACLPKLRHTLAEKSLQQFDGLNQQFEQRIGSKFSESLRRAKQHITVAYPDSSDSERMEHLLRLVSKDFNETLTLATGELYPLYHAEMNRIHSYLTDLTVNPEAELTEKERLHKEILETLLQILMRRQQ